MVMMKCAVEPQLLKLKKLTSFYRSRYLSGASCPPQRERINYYFAYGSNMNPIRMKARKVTFFERLPATLSGYELKLNKVMPHGTAAANINPNPDSEVHGALYICANDVFDKLDVFEMVAEGHYSKECVAVKVGDTIYGAVTYIDKNKINDDLEINRYYLEHILCGKDLLPPDYYEFLESFYSRCKD